MQFTNVIFNTYKLLLNKKAIEANLYFFAPKASCLRFVQRLTVMTSFRLYLFIFEGRLNIE